MSSSRDSSSTARQNGGPSRPGAGGSRLARTFSVPVFGLMTRSDRVTALRKGERGGLWNICRGRSWGRSEGAIRGRCSGSPLCPVQLPEPAVGASVFKSQSGLWPLRDQRCRRSFGLCQFAPRYPQRVLQRVIDPGPVPHYLDCTIASIPIPACPHLQRIFPLLPLARPAGRLFAFCCLWCRMGS